MKSAPRSILFLVMPALLCAQAKHTPTFDEMLSLKTIASPKISPDGRFVAYRMRETNWKDNAYVWQLWLVNVTTGASFQLTRGKESANDEEWSPDGKWLAFVTKREASAIEPRPIEKKQEGKDGRTGRRGQTGGTSNMADLAGRRRGVAIDKIGEGY